MEQKVIKNSDWFNSNACITDVDIKESICRWGKIIRRREGFRKWEVDYR